MADIVGEVVSSHGYQALTNGYEKAQQFIQASDAKGRVLAAMTDRNTKMEQVGLLNSQAAQFSSAHSVSVQLNSVSKQVISEMAKLPADVNIEIADKIRISIQNGDWPKNKSESSRAVQAVIRDYHAFSRR